MKKILFTVFFYLSIVSCFAQANGDYRTRVSGYWNTVNTWQVYNNGWFTLSTPAAGPYQNILPSAASGAISITHAVTVNGAITTVNQTTISAGAVLTIQSGKILRVVDDFTSTPLTVQGGSPRGLIVNNGTLDFQTQLSTTPCLIDGFLASNGTILSSNPSLITFSSGSIYQHSNLTGGAIPIATWDTNSVCHIFGLKNANPAKPENLNQAFGNFRWDNPNMGATTTFSLDGQLTTVNGDLIFNNTGNTPREVRFASGGPGYNLNIGGNFILNGGIVTLSESQTSPTTINVGGNIIMSGGIVTIGRTNNANIDIFVNGNFQKTGGNLSRGTGTGLGTIHFNGGVQTFANNGDFASAINFVVENGSTVDLGNSYFSGTGTFTLMSGGTINVGATHGNGAIQANTVAGNIRNSGGRTYQAGSTIVYNGAAGQFIGTGHPAGANTTINNPNNVSLIGNVTINGALSQQEGILNIGSNTLTLGGAYSRVNGYFGITTLSNLIINGTGDFVDLILSPQQFAGNPMRNLTLNRNGTVFLGNSLIVAGTFNQTAGTFSLGEFSAYTLTLQGNFIQTGGAISSFNNSGLVIEGTGTLPADVNIAGPNLLTLTMNRPSTFTTTSPLTLGNLNLYNGVVNNPSFNLLMAPNGTLIRRPNGSITQVLGAITSYDVIYEATANITTGNELPFTSPVTTRLDDLTILGTANVFLTHDIVVNGNLSITGGTFDVDVDNDVTINGNLNVDGVFETREGLVTFAGASPQTISGAAQIPFYDVVVNQSASSTVAVSTGVTVENSLAVNSASVLNAGNQLLTLMSSSAGTAYVSQLNALASIEGTVIAQRFLPNAAAVRNWRFITPVVTGSSVADWKTELQITGTFSDPFTGPGIISNNPSMYIYDETFTSGGPAKGDRYRPYPTSGLASAAPLVNGLGYSVFARTTGEITFDSRGRLGQGATPVGVTSTGGGVNAGWNLIGNPYPAPIDWDLVSPSLPGAVDDAVYITDANDNGGVGGNVYYSGGVSVPASWQGIIAPGQAFFVHATSNATITFQESHKFAGQTQFYREKEVDNVLRISIAGANLSDELAVRLHENATDSFDKSLDAYKYFETALAIATLTPDGEKLAINSINKISCGKPIPLMIETASAGSFTLTFAGIESLDNGLGMHLRDKITNQLIDLSSHDSYQFSTSDASSLKDRFELIVDGMGIETSLDVAGESICENSSVAYVTVSNSQPNVHYRIQWNGQDVSEEIVGTGSALQLPLNVALLPQGEQQVSVFAFSGSCMGVALTKQATVAIAKLENIVGVKHGAICEEGSATLRVHGTPGLKYNWYENETDVTPIASVIGEEFVTPALKKSKTYYVAAVNSLGCEGDKMPVKAEVGYIDAVTITQEGFMLLSNYEEGNEWYLDNVPLNIYSKSIELSASGTYTLQVTKGGCLESTFVNVSLDEERLLESIVVYPNPTADKVTIQIKRSEGTPRAKLISPVGIELTSVDLKKDNDKHSGYLDLIGYPQGVYLIQINDGQRTYIKKVSKL